MGIMLRGTTIVPEPLTLMLVARFSIMGKAHSYASDPRRN